MHAVIDIAQPTTPVADPERAVRSTPDTTPVAKPAAFGRDLALFLPAAILFVFVFGTAAIATRTDTLAAAAGFAAYLSFWLGGGFGFLAAGIRWGLRVEAADHSAHRHS
ncbi:MAG: hypothetical protein AAF962_15180 [Actinomycetota bacterium]